MGNIIEANPDESLYPLSFYSLTYCLDFFNATDAKQREI